MALAAQADAISKGDIRARTLHSATAMRVQSMANKNMAPGAKQATLTHIWRNKILLVNEEVSMIPGRSGQHGNVQILLGTKRIN